jgi:hypothetical protein
MPKIEKKKKIRIRYMSVLNKYAIWDIIIFYKIFFILHIINYSIVKVSSMALI